MGFTSQETCAALSRRWEVISTVVSWYECRNPPSVSERPLRFAGTTLSAAPASDGGAPHAVIASLEAGVCCTVF